MTELKAVAETCVETQRPLQYEILLLSTQELIERYWTQCVPLLEKVVATSDGEFTVDDLLALAQQGKAFVIVAKNDDTEVPTVGIVMVLEIVQYPQFHTMNIMCLGGSEFRCLKRQFMQDLYGWAKVIGVRKMECRVSPVMERMLAGTGFKQRYIVLRHDLAEAGHENDD